ncbi:MULTISPECIES: hypothetical protein [Pedobacter]|uniref:Uncharacterized protein n=1 Tax=Pedobacter zeae TaxID=1737356 RepID=A0A7W6P6S3_9SPHI|nr:hypothetical protein [Pedobacter zeae]MBB4108276.1 hypothetical protein [Pedobacter zeae]GGG93875.1 hypothetical protein GCM10007422_03960 [Pedobacter zeae]
MEKKRYAKEFVAEDLRTRTHFIPLETANRYIESFHKNRSSLIPKELQEEDRRVAILPLSETFNIKSVSKLLSRRGCEGLRVHFGLNDHSQVVLVLRAVDGLGNDIIGPVSRPGKKMPKLMALSANTSQDNDDNLDTYSLDDSQRVPPWPAEYI